MDLGYCLMGETGEITKEDLVLRGRLGRIGTLFLAITLMAGCVGGGGLNSGGTSDQYGFIVLSIRHNGSMQDDVSPQLVPVEADRLRLRVYNEVSNVIKDVEITDEVISVEVRLPIGTYSIDGLAYKTHSDWPDLYGFVLTAGTTHNVVVQPGKNTAAKVTLDKLGFVIDGPTEPVEGGGQVEVVAEIDPRGFGIEGAELRYDTEKWIEDDPHVGYRIPGQSSSLGSGNVRYTFAIPTPSESFELAIYYQMLVNFDLNDYGYERFGMPVLYLTGPSLSAGDGLGEIIVTPPEGGIIIEVE